MSNNTSAKALRKARAADAMESRHDPAGVYRIVNEATGRTWVGSSLKMTSRLTRHRFELQNGSSGSKEMQEEWNRYGEASFRFEIVEALKEPDDDTSYDVETVRALEAEYRAVEELEGRHYGIAVPVEHRRRMR